MKNKQDKLKNYLENILSIPSPSGYTYELTKYIKKELNNLNIPYQTTNKDVIIVTFKGENDENQRTFSAHIDTLGGMVREIKANGTLSIVFVGGFTGNSVEGENCIISTLDNKTYTGTIQSIKPSVHVSGDESGNLKRTAHNLEVILDEKVFTKEDVENLGINVGDFISFDPRTTFTEKGFIKSRHLDDKAGVAILLYVMEYIHTNNVKLPYTTNFFISNYEEVGHGASAALPLKTTEFISIDMGAPGPGQNSSEYSVCICAKDSSGPYDYELRKTLVNICKENEIDYKIDTYPHYGSDASTSLRAGWDVRTALIGPGVFASHSYERTHMDSLIATLELVLKYSQSK